MLFCTTLVLIFLPRFFSPADEPPSELIATDKAGTTVLVSHTIGTAAGTPEGGEVMGETKHHLFLFDPNTVTRDGLQRLGMRTKTINTLLHYREKGGQFRHADDIRKVYGLKKEEADRLIPYINIVSARGQSGPGSKDVPVRQALASGEAAPVNPVSFAGTNTYRLSPGKQFLPTNINTATAEEWRRFPGIGAVLSNRIVAFRNKLGAFHSVLQVGQTYGIPDSVFKRMEPYLYLDSVDSKGASLPGGRLSRSVVLPVDASPL